ncbi:hypothetical protein [Streptomyces bauhiniae]|uniref:Uncharacterized protein n=1 Tax=Streptomyces bauhiniae TaxID=2340725 RepID=A0A7K3QVX5_9ACTN|nr:hypothetical protein [Streptomyces bauhiniae]NEB94020.1 hypothetical protein [Streptomyces bauhiniae]
MPLVVIQPSYGNPAARRHWRDTLDGLIDFRTHPRSDFLTSAQRRQLDEFHPGGTARFWGATRVQDTKMDRLRPGDVVLFTGKNHIRGIGEIGALFRNAPFADSMWSHDPIKGSWHNVYSLLSFTPSEIPYKEVWALPGFNAGDNFMGLRVLDSEKAETILQGLGIETQADIADDSARQEPAARALRTHTSIVDGEALHTPATRYVLAERELVVNRTEALLLQEYAKTLGIEQPRRLRTPAGITDLHVPRPDGSEVVEAKRASTRRFVREALAQLLDYAPHTPEPATLLTALFPTRPADQDLALLHRYGIDCVYRTHPSTFERTPAAQEVRVGMTPFWQQGDQPA